MPWARRRMLSAPGLPWMRADRAAVRLLLLDVLADPRSPSGSCRCRDRSCAAPASSAVRSASIVITGIVGLAASMVCAISGRSTARSRSPRCRPCRACPGRSAPRRPRRRSRPGRCRSTRTRSSAFSAFHFSQPWLIASKNGLSRPLTTMTSCFLSCAMAGAGAERQRRRGGKQQSVSSLHSSLETGGMTCRRTIARRRSSACSSILAGAS